MTGTSITDKALARLQSIGEGNHIDAADITVIRSDEANYTITAELVLSPRWEVGVASPGELKSLQAQPMDSLDALRSQVSCAVYPTGWVDAALVDLDNTPTKGWGLDGQVLRLDNFTQLYAVSEMCPTCNGNGQNACQRCNNTGVGICEYCMVDGVPTGHDKQNPGAPCRMCGGSKRSKCSVCNGTGALACAVCRGRGQKQTTYTIKLYADTRFNWIGGTDLPTALRRAIDRAGLAKLSNGHAKIQREEHDGDIVPARIGYTADFPFAAAQFSVAGEKCSAAIFGLKAAILEMPDFLDKKLEAAERNNEIHDYRIYHEAQVVRARQGNVNELTRLYPAGLSRDMASHIMEIAGHKLRRQTRGPRMAATGGLLLASLVTSWIYMMDAMRRVIEATGYLRAFDIALPFVLAAIIIVGQRFIMKVMLEKQLRQKNLRPPYFGLHTIGAIAVLFVVYGWLLWHASPVWLNLNVMLLQAEWQQWLRYH